MVNLICNIRFKLGYGGKKIWRYENNEQIRSKSLKFHFYVQFVGKKYIKMSQHEVRQTGSIGLEPESPPLLSPLSTVDSTMIPGVGFNFIKDLREKLFSLSFAGDILDTVKK